MFERYTERARRVIFFARYEASKFRSRMIETEHLLLALGEDRNLAERFFGGESAVNDLRVHLEGRAGNREKSDTSASLALSDECKRILAYAAEEAERLNHRRIGTEHLLLGILREERCAAAQILHERGLRVIPIREGLARTPMPPDRAEKPEGLRGILSTASRISSAPDMVPDA